MPEPKRFAIPLGNGEEIMITIEFEDNALPKIFDGEPMPKSHPNPAYSS